MGMVYADIVLINGLDESDARQHKIGEEEVRRIPINILVDTGSYMLAINENLQEYLQLPVTDRKKSITASGQIIECDVVSPIVLLFKNRRFSGSALVLPGDNQPLLGCIPLEEMDVIIHPIKNELMVNPEHPLYAVMRI